MKTYRAAQSRFGGRMREQDCGELFTLLSCFHRTYAIHEDEVKLVLETIAEAYSTEYDHPDTRAIEILRNPRGAGRKKKLTESDEQHVQDLHREGYTVREIADLTGISKSSIQRML